MPQIEHFDVVILGSGQGGKKLAWHLAQTGKKVAVVERRWVGGSCPAVACMPSKNELWSARVAYLARNAARFGTLVDGIKIDMARVRERKRGMVDREITFHLQAYKKSGAELIMGNGRFIGPKTIEVALNEGGTRVLAGTETVINVGSHAAIPDIPGLREAQPLTHIEVLELDDVPAHLIVLGGGYTGIEMAQAFRRFGSLVTIIEPAPRIMGREDADVADAIGEILSGEGIDLVAGGNRRTDDRLIPHVMFTDPPLAHVGLSEGEAQRRGIPIRVAKLPMHNVLRTQATDETEGFMKVLVGTEDDFILGFTMIGSEAGKVIAAIQTAILAQLPYTRLRDAVIAHLTVAEGLGPLFESLPARSV